MNVVTRARQLRRKATWAEKALWRILRNERFSGYKFRRQQPAGDFTLDFYCPEARLALEVDGIGHGHPERRIEDERRDEFLSSRGILVKRIWNSQLRGQLKPVREVLWQLLQERAPHPGNVKPARRVTPRVLNPDLDSAGTPHPIPLPVRRGEGVRSAVVGSPRRGDHLRLASGTKTSERKKP